jgi:hypothetical protein
MPKHYCLSLLFIFVLQLACLPAYADEDEIYGPVSTFKSVPIPFGAPVKEANSARLPAARKTGEMTFDLASDDANASLKLPIAGALGKIEAEPASDPAFSPINLSSSSGRLLDRLLQNTRLYLPGSLVIGHTEEFVIKGKAGSYVALAMADKDSGAKPIYGHPLRLGPDRKVVALGQIPKSGVLSLFICTPIEGDLIGQDLFFEAAVWQKGDFSDLQLAKPVDLQGQASSKNGVIVAAENVVKRGPRIVPHSLPPSSYMAQPGIPDMDSGRP